MKRFICSTLLAVSALYTVASHAKTTEIVVDYAYADTFNSVHKEIAKEFMAKYPQYKIRFKAPTKDYEDSVQQSLRQSITGQLSDVSFQGLNRQRIFVDRGIAVDLTPFIQAEKDWNSLGYSKSLLSLGQVNNKQVGIGFSLSTPIVYYNADLLKKVNITAANFPKTWDGIIDVATKSAQASTNTKSLYVDWTISGNWMWQALVFSNGGSMLDTSEKKVAFTGPAGVKAINTLSDMATKAHMPNYSYDSAAQEFAAGNMAVLVTTTARLAIIEKMAGSKFHVLTAKMPVEQNGRLPAGGNVAMIFAKDPEKQKAAWDYIKFATGPVGATIMAKSTGYFPANTIPANDSQYLKSFYQSHPNNLTAIDQLPVLTGWYAFPGENGLKITDVINDQLQTVVAQEAKPQDALKKMGDSVQSLLPKE